VKNLKVQEDLARSCQCKVQGMKAVFPLSYYMIELRYRYAHTLNLYHHYNCCYRLDIGTSTLLHEDQDIVDLNEYS
jgi:hypothetical protein